MILPPVHGVGVNGAFLKRRLRLPLLREQQVTVLKKLTDDKFALPNIAFFAPISNLNCDFTSTFFHIVFLPLLFQNEGSVYPNS